MKATNRSSCGCSARACRLAAIVGAMSVGVATALAQLPSGKVIVADVIPQGNKNVPSEKIMSLIKTKPNGEYNPDVIAEDVQRLYETRSFANIRVTEQRRDDGKVIVYFQFVELPGIIQEIVYQGANHLKNDELESITGLRKGAPLNPIATRLARDAILRKYQEKGRLSATVDILEGDKVGDNRVVFNIAEGPVVKVGGTDFVGNTFVSASRLRTQINTSRAFLGVLGGDFNPLMADLDVSKLEEYYRGFGYHDVRVSRELRWDENQRYVTLIFHIHEGQRYKVAKVDVTGLPDKERQELLKFNSLHTGDLFSQQKADTDKTKMKDYVGYTGRDDVIQQAVYYPADRPGEVVINYEVQERPPARVGQVIVVGNEVTRQNVILRQVPLYPGQPLTYPGPAPRGTKPCEAQYLRIQAGIRNPADGYGARPRHRQRIQGHSCQCS